MTDQINFEKNEDGNYIGYHIECISDCKENATSQLMVETLNNDKPLFLSNNPRHWYPFHLNQPDNYRVLKVVFKPCMAKSFDKEKSYARLFHMIAYKDNPNLYKFKMKNAGKKLLEQGYQLFILDPKDELHEAFLCNPVDHVVSIEEIEMPAKPDIKIEGLPGLVQVEFHEGVQA